MQVGLESKNLYQWYCSRPSLIPRPSTLSFYILQATKHWRCRNEANSILCDTAL